MPYNWTPTSERQMLLVAITKANLRPTSETWAAVALELGNGLTPSAVSQKFYKLRHESNVLSGDASSTPRKRKRKSDPQTTRGVIEENDTSAVTASMVAPQLLIASHPHNKMHRVDEETQNRDTEQATPIKKQKIKSEHHDDLEVLGSRCISAKTGKPEADANFAFWDAGFK